MAHATGHVFQAAIDLKNMNYYSQIKWVDEYIKNVAPYIFVREEDLLLIKIPNQAYKLNKQGLKILKELLSGTGIYSIIDASAFKPESKELLDDLYQRRESIARDVHYFFCDMRSVLKGCYRQSDKREAVEKIPFSIPFNSLPVLSEIALTYRCNLSCRFCYAGCGCRKNEKFKELSTDRLKEILFIIKNHALVPSVSFTGGEPILRDDIKELVSYAKEIKMWTNIITNGTLITKEIALLLKRAGLDSAQVSLEAGNAELHDYIVRKPGAFQKTIRGIGNLIEAGIRVHTNTTICRTNKDSLREVLVLIKELGLDRFSMNMLMPEGSALVNLGSIFVAYTEIGDIVTEVQRHAKNLKLEFMWYSPTPMCIFNPILHGLGNKGCAACDGLLSITPGGDIIPCSSYPRQMGNILKMKGRFIKVWSSSKFKYFQQKRFAHKICKNCSEFAVCNGGCPLYWKQVGYTEIFENKKMIKNSTPGGRI